MNNKTPPAPAPLDPALGQEEFFRKQMMDMQNDHRRLGAVGLSGSPSYQRPVPWWHWFHEWTPWSEPYVGNQGCSTEQSRTCIVCQKQQRHVL